MAIYGPTPDASTSSKGKIMLSGDLGGTADAPSLSLNSICQGRLTLTSGTPITTSDVTSAGTIYFTPYKGDRVALYNGSSWSLYTLSERSLALTATSGSVYDVFLYDNSGTLTLETLVWANTTTRATALVMQDGILCKSGAPTRRYLGTFYATGTNQTSDSGGGADTAGWRCLWNYYNRVSRKMNSWIETPSFWNYSSATVRGQAGLTVSRMNLVVGVSEDAVTVIADSEATCSGGPAYASVGIGRDSSTAWTTARDIFVTSGATYTGTETSLMDYPGVGFHYYQALESGPTATTTWWGGTARNSGIKGTVMA